MALWMHSEAMQVRRRSQPLTSESLKVRDHVRLSKVKNVFCKGYLPSWTEEVFTVSELHNTSPPQVKVKDYNGEVVQGSFYLEEVQLVDKPATYRIERIIRQH